MILLLGGTSDSAPLAEALAQRGYQVLVSTATETELNVGQHPAIQRRCGVLDKAAMITLIQEKSVQAIVDATHPYAALVRATASDIAEQLELPYFSFVRPTSVSNSEKSLHFAPDHQAAAQLAVTYQRPILLTIGVKNLWPYVTSAGAVQVPLIARVLPTDSSHQAGRAAGLSDKNIILARGPFSVADNRAIIRRFNIGVLVTKDGGAAGGVPEKLEAAQTEGCEVIVVQRPALPRQAYFSNINQLVDCLCQQLE
ncbi:MAG: precorrin-6A reductase [Candidatus Parabeggiatoa sp. nov. 1]|nr:MAG: precorrin-6A reductase [Gammaproteobacteria bacterium]